MIDNLSSSMSTAQRMAAPKDKSVLGKDDFFKMLLTQLKNQDPTSPLDGTEFAAQMAQFTSLEQLRNMNDTLEASMNANLQLAQSVNNTMTATLIGKEVKIGGNTLKYEGQEKIGFGYKLAADAHTVTINIYDSNNKLVKTIETPSTQMGDTKLYWDFTDNANNKVPKGEYRFEVEAKMSNEDKIAVSLFKYGTIDAIRFNELGTHIVVGNIEYSLSDVLEIINSKINR